MTVKPLYDRVLIKVKEEPEKVVGGIILPETVRKTPNQGEVIAVGPGRIDNGVLIEPSVSVGDNVVYNKMAGSELEMDEEGTYLIIREEDIYAIID